MEFLFKRICPSDAAPSSCSMMATLLVLGAVLYNAILAVINAYILPVGALHVIACEFLIVGVGFAYIALHIRYFPAVLAPFSLLVFSILIFLYVSFMQEHFYIKSLRDILLIVMFFMLGGLASEKNIVSAFRIISLVTLVFLIVEIFLTDLYASIFKPASYYANTRGIEQLATDQSGLFRNALGYESRFSIGILSAHRTASVFLEQVSLANFSMLLSIFLAAFWHSIRRLDKIIFISLIILVLLTNSSRTALVMIPIIAAGYFIFPRLPRFSTLVYMPVILLLAFLLFYDPGYTAMGDNLAGRIGHTLHQISIMGADLFKGGSTALINKTGDSGYAYYLYTQTIFGLLVFWLFTTFSIPQEKPEEKRYAHGLNIFIFVNLLIGAAVLSIKVSAPLWFVAGYLYYSRFRMETEEGRGA